MPGERLSVMENICDFSTFFWDAFGKNAHSWNQQIRNKQRATEYLIQEGNWSCGAQEDSWESLGFQGDQTSQS